MTMSTLYAPRAHLGLLTDFVRSLIVSVFMIAMLCSLPASSNNPYRASMNQPLLQQAASECLSDSQAEAALLIAAEGLSAVCAMELRAMLLAATQAQRALQMQSAITDIRQSTSTIRTMGKLLAPRLRSSSVESDLAHVMLVQGSNVSDLAQALEAALKPSPYGPSVRTLSLLRHTVCRAVDPKIH
jgi:hypothetical protein